MPGNPGDLRVVAFVVRGDRDIIRVELGAAKPIAELVDRWRESFGRSDDSRKAANELRQRLWDPLAEHLDGCETVLISPDGQVSRFPWGALPGDKPGTYLLEERAIALVPTPQLLLEILGEKPRVPQSSDPVLLVGDIDFNSAPPAARQDQESFANLRELAGLNPVAGELDGTRREIQQIGDLYTKVFGSPRLAAMLTRSQATETALNENAPKARYVHIATHGYFEEVKIGRGIELASLDGRGLRSPALTIGMFGDQTESTPMVRSGLLLASVNRPRPWSVEDGKWTALEVGALDLSGVDLVVLSACETGIGTVVGGEGVLGLQRSFHAAGARTCVTSLWKVDDDATQELMTEFYRNLWEKKLPKLEALRQAQLKMLRDYNPQHAPSRGTEVELAPLPSGQPVANATLRILLPTLGLSLAAFAVWLIVRIVKRQERWAKRTAAALVLALALSPFTAAPAIRLFEQVFPQGALPVAAESKPSAESPQDSGSSPYYWAAFVLSGDWR
ncbi:MAG: CHAT domain-containing protein [Planctomycetes bacterium]|nr:CHAT domain-containing protein [Planctomycetota bacterium]